MSASSTGGKIVIVPTPIGNLGDVTERVREALGAADIVASEDTRRTGRLLQHLGLSKRQLSLNEHNEQRRAPKLLEACADGQMVALVSDAGTPLVSDPGYLLVREAIGRGLQVEALPGPAAFVTALVLSGLPPTPMTFAGFPPPKPGKRRRFYRRFAELEHTLVFYESPHRLLRSIEDAIAELGDRRAAIARELTKLHEEVLRGKLGDLRSELSQRDKLLGELVVVVEGAGR